MDPLPARPEVIVYASNSGGWLRGRCWNTSHSVPWEPPGHGTLCLAGRRGGAFKRGFRAPAVAGGRCKGPCVPNPTICGKRQVGGIPGDCQKSPRAGFVRNTMTSFPSRVTKNGGGGVIVLRTNVAVFGCLSEPPACLLSPGTPSLFPPHGTDAVGGWLDWVRVPVCRIVLNRPHTTLFTPNRSLAQAAS